MFGIESFTTNCEGFNGVIKKSWEDFEVREISLDGVVSNLTTGIANSKKSDQFVETSKKTAHSDRLEATIKDHSSVNDARENEKQNIGIDKTTADTNIGATKDVSSLVLCSGLLDENSDVVPLRSVALESKVIKIEDANARSDFVAKPLAVNQGTEASKQSNHTFNCGKQSIGENVSTGMNDRLNDTTKQLAATSFNEDPKEALRSLLQVSTISSLDDLDGNSEGIVNLGCFENKETRLRIHQYLRYEFPHLKTLTVKNQSGGSEMITSADEAYKMFLQTGIKKEHLDEFFRFVHCQFIIQNKNTFILQANNDKQQRTTIHRLIAKHFGAFLESKSFTSQGSPDMGAISNINIRFRRKRQFEVVDQTSNNASKNLFSFVLCKKNTETLNAISKLSSALKIKPSQISYAGVKDKKAVTFQKMAAMGVELEDLEYFMQNSQLANMAIGNINKEENALHLGDLSGNNFKIVVRDVSRKLDNGNIRDQHLKESKHSKSVNVKDEILQESGKLVTEELAIEHSDSLGFENATVENSLKNIIDKAISEVKISGFINYFGLQRFGLEENEINTADIGLAIIKGEMMKAVELILTPNGQQKDESNEAKFYFQQTKDIVGTLKRMPDWKTRECLILKGLKQHGFSEAGCTNALFNLPYSIRLMYVHSYCSLVWNKIATARMKKFGLFVAEGDIVNLNSESSKKNHSNNYCVASKKDIDSQKFDISQVVLPMPGFRIEYPSNMEEMYNDILNEDGAERVNFKIKKLRLNVPGAYRHFISYPCDLSWSFYGENDGNIEEKPEKKSPEGKEEGYRNFDMEQQKSTSRSSNDIELKFSLKPSSYATICLREIMKN